MHFYLGSNDQFYSIVTATKSKSICLWIQDRQHICVSGSDRGFWAATKRITTNRGVGGGVCHTGVAEGALSPNKFQSNKTMVFLTNTQSSFAFVVLDGVLGPSCLMHHTLRCLHLWRTEAMPSWTLRLSVRSAQKALQESEIETMEVLGGTDEKGISPMRIRWFAL